MIFNSIEVNYKGEWSCVVILNLDYYYCALTHGCIAHEATHISDYIFDRVGAKHDINNPEPYSYLVGWVTDKCYETIENAGMIDKLTHKKVRRKK